MGGGGGDDGYQQRQAAIEAKKQAARDALNAQFGTAQERDPVYQTVRDNTFDAGKTRLDEQRDEAARKLKFELFARGLNSGSEDVNQNALLGRTYSNGLLDLGAKADAAKADFRGDDENARLGLLQSIDSGVDQGSAISSAINSMKTNSDKAAAQASGTTLGDVFANTGLLYNKSQTALGKQAGTEWWNTQGAPSGKKASNVNGMISATGG